MKRQRATILGAALVAVIVTSQASARNNFFTDVPKDAWYYAAVESVTALGILKGTSEDTFDPDKFVTRAEMAQIASNILQASKTQPRASTDADSATINAIANAMPSVVYLEAGNSCGAGVIIDDTHILTAWHVIDSGAPITVRMYNGKQYAGKFIKHNNSDLAIVEFKPEGEAKSIQLASSVTLGQTAIAIGHPLNEYFSVSKGVVSHIDSQPIGLQKYIQTDAAVNPGNSGGALIDTQGHLIGVVAMHRLDAKKVGYAVALEDVKTFIGQ